MAVVSKSQTMPNDVLMNTEDYYLILMVETPLLTWIGVDSLWCIKCDSEPFSIGLACFSTILVDHTN